MAIIYYDAFHSSRQQADFASKGTLAATNTATYGPGATVMAPKAKYKGQRALMRGNGNPTVDAPASQNDTIYMRELGKSLREVLAAGGLAFQVKALYTADNFTKFAEDGAGLFVLKSANVFRATRDFETYTTVVTYPSAGAGLSGKFKFNNGYFYETCLTRADGWDIRRFATDGSGPTTFDSAVLPTPSGWGAFQVWDAVYDGSQWIAIGTETVSPFRVAVWKSTDFAAWSVAYSGASGGATLVNSTYTMMRKISATEYVAFCGGQGTNYSGKLYSEDNGVTWTQVATTNSSVSMLITDCVKFNGLYVYSTVAFATGTSTTAAGIWTSATIGGAMTRAVTLAPGVAQLLVNGTTLLGFTPGARLYTSTNATTWTAIRGTAVIGGSEPSTLTGRARLPSNHSNGCAVVDGYVYAASMGLSDARGLAVNRYNTTDYLGGELVTARAPSIPTGFGPGSVGGTMGLLITDSAGFTNGTLAGNLTGLGGGFGVLKNFNGVSYGIVPTTSAALAAPIPDEAWQLIEMTLQDLGNGYVNFLIYMDDVQIMEYQYAYTTADLDGRMYVYLPNNQWSHYSDLVITDYSATDLPSGRLGNIQSMSKLVTGDVVGEAPWTRLPTTNPSNASTAYAPGVSQAIGKNVSSADAGVLDTYTSPLTVPTGKRVLAVQLEGVARRSVVGGQVIQPGFDLGGGTTVERNVYVTSAINTDQYFSSLVTKAPAGSTLSQVAGANIKLGRIVVPEPALTDEVLAITGETAINDITTWARTITTSATRSTESHNGLYSMQSAGTNINQRIIVTPKATDPLSFGTGDFTLSFWTLLPTSVVSTWITTWGPGYGTNLGLAIVMGATPSTALFYLGYSGNAVSQPCTFNLGVWQHVALVRQNGVFRGYIQGIKYFEDASQTAYNVVCSGMSFMGYDSEITPGRIDSIRVWPRAVYNANFTPV